MVPGETIITGFDGLIGLPFTVPELKAGPYFLSFELAHY